MSLNHHYSDAITTDALPNPRNDQDDERARDEDNINDSEDKNVPRNTNQIPRVSSRGFNTRKKSNTKKFSLPAASATIVNISGSKDVHVGTNIVFNLGGNERNEKTNIPKTPAIRQLLVNTKIVTEENLNFIASHIDLQYKDTARALGLGDGQISQFIADYQIHGTKEIIYQILLDWYRNEPLEATIGKLCNILWNNGQKSAVLRWSQENV